VGFLLKYCHSSHYSLHPTGQKLNRDQDLGIKVATPVGTLVGQLLFGWLADIVGRKRMCEYPNRSRASAMPRIYSPLSITRWGRANNHYYRNFWSSSFRKWTCGTYHRRLSCLAFLSQCHISKLQGSLTSSPCQMGVGIGGDYPLSAIITSEFATIRTRGRLMTAVFACQGWGNLCVSTCSF
jgi:PHS family inorganic phosphate transporter-like MFS transporter